ncbi:MAG TPA: phosphate ABC transporter permease subunit PstC [Acidimicrobiales bacterium]|jgi:phosphate transport system permease protein|nr:phosphate ABC transporter permease subunit PstC [Acidimicrobiales bacterium]
MSETPVVGLLEYDEMVEEPVSSTISRTWYHYALLAAALLFTAISLGFVGTIFWSSWPEWIHHGVTLLTGKGWTSPDGPFGGLPMIVGTVETSLIALVIAVIIGLGTSISIVFFIPRRFRMIVATLVELLAAIPSVVYGLWGLLVIAPWMQTTVNPWLNSWPFAKEIFGNPGQEFGTSLLLASIVLGIMILPTFVAISREVIAVVPQDLMEASLSLGATRWQMIREVVLPTAKVGLFGATFLALARATGETVAVALVAGSVANVQFHLAYPGTSIAAWIATEFGEAQGNEVSALMALGVLLMLLNVCLALISRSLVARQRRALARV